MDEIEVDVTHAEALELRLEHLAVVAVRLDVELRGHMERIAGIARRERLAEKPLGGAAVIHPRRVEVVDAARHGVVNDRLCPRIVDRRAVLVALGRKAHGTHAKPRELYVLEGLVLHRDAPPSERDAAAKTIRPARLSSSLASRKPETT